MAAIRRLAVVAACVTALATGVRAAELTVLSAGAITAVARSVAPAFEADHGISVELRTDTVGGLVRRIAGGEPFDVVLMSPAGLADLEKAGKIAPGSPSVLAKVGVGVGIRAGAAAPDLRSVEGFKAALLASRAVAYVDPASGGTSGIYVANLFRTLGIADAMAPKSVLVKGGHAADAVTDGSADLALQQISEIIGVPGVTLAGPLPPEIQLYTTYSGAIAADTLRADKARAFVATMMGPNAKGAMAARGMGAP